MELQNRKQLKFTDQIIIWLQNEIRSKSDLVGDRDVSLTLTEEQKDDILTALSEYHNDIAKFDQFSAECERLEILIDLVTWLKPIKDDEH